MSWQVMLGFVRALVWPVTIIVLGLTFRRQVIGLFGRLTSAATPLGTFDFQAAVAPLEHEATKLTAGIAGAAAQVGSSADGVVYAARPGDVHIPQPGAGPPSGTVRPQPSPGVIPAGFDEDRFDALMRLCDISPRAAVLDAWRDVEQAMTTAVGAPAPATGRPTAPVPSAPAPAPGPSGTSALPAAMITPAGELRALRDRVAEDKGAVVTAAGAKSFVRTAHQLVLGMALAGSPALRPRP